MNAIVLFGDVIFGWFDLISKNRNDVAPQKVLRWNLFL